MYIGRPPFIEQLNDISFWYPILVKIGMQTPRTKLLYADVEIGHIVDGKKTDSFKHLVTEVEHAKSLYGGEAFLRTGHTSNKHKWSKTCHLTEDSKVGQHIASLVEFSMMADLPYTTFAVREMIDTKAITVAFENMPIAREVRLFVENGKLICAHPYWPSEAFGEEDVTPRQMGELHTMPDMEELTKMAEYVSRHFDMAWSVDFLQDAKGEWWLTDMALASTSYHWPDCGKKDISREK